MFFANIFQINNLKTTNQNQLELASLDIMKEAILNLNSFQFVKCTTVICITLGPHSTIFKIRCKLSATKL